MLIPPDNYYFQVFAAEINNKKTIKNNSDLFDLLYKIEKTLLFTIMGL